ncbi:agamous-like MADS-box protein AGL80 [Brachypodium distachyon]|uniref:MADS-box domain-containing protein n=1 Tax=Brachypodium distachyon TaxID=15368 RepID=A0A0Q3IDM4_BRADI|nr:agamous-like MADS-box protein AGL80 [Brachypodium distachyon]KQK04003.1 hypothetical protein BRADI_2g11145v3 [Brachypodium distachyon]|eukprot:XP_003565683.1 agamous-like MADS-box protein AGL80 [Brachypodium distachyon]
MARKKVTLQWIPNDATRRATFKKRRKGLMKKASELATLCDVKACVVVYGEGEAQPEVWPSVAEAVPILNRFKDMPELDQCKKMMNQEDFLRQRIDKLREQIHKAGRENRERDTTSLVHKAMVGCLPGLTGLTIEELTSVGWMVEMRLKGLSDRIASVRGQNGGQHQIQASFPAPYGAAGNMMADTGAPSSQMYIQAPQKEAAGWLDMVRSGGDLGALVYSGYAGGSGAGDGMAQFSNLGAGFSWAWGADAGPSGSSFLPM